MLVLQRKPGEEIVIGEGPGAVIIQVIEVRQGHKVRLGITAPMETRVDRVEVRRRREHDGHRA